MDSPGNYSLCGLGGENRKRSPIYSLLASHLPSPIFILKSENNSLVYNSSSRRGGFKIPHSCYSCFRLGYESASLPLRFNKNNKTNSTKTVSHTCVARAPPHHVPPALSPVLRGSRAPAQVRLLLVLLARRRCRACVRARFRKGRDFRHSPRGRQGARAAELRVVAGASSARVAERRPGSQPGAAVARAPERNGRRASARPVKGREPRGEEKVGAGTGGTRPGDRWLAGGCGVLAGPEGGASAGGVPGGGPPGRPRGGGCGWSPGSLWAPRRVRATAGACCLHLWVGRDRAAPS